MGSWMGAWDDELFHDGGNGKASKQPNLFLRFQGEQERDIAI